MSDQPSGSATFLFTDLEDSTRIWDEHPGAMRTALARHDAILLAAIDESDGRLIKSTGDGAYAVFAEASAAITAAVRITRRLAAESWDTTGPLLARIGIHTGIAEERDGDYFGPVLNRASRLMALGHGGQVLLSKASVAAAGEELPHDVTYQDLGEHRLRGLQVAERVVQLVMPGISERFPPLHSIEAFPGKLDLPLPLVTRGAVEFAGRTTEMADLMAVWNSVVGASMRVAVVAGEPGIGKTRLLQQLSHRVHEQGGLVLYGRCDEERVVPHQPFVEALRPCVGSYPAGALHQRLGGLEPYLARAFPELLGRVPDLESVLPSDAEAERYRFFEAITALVTGITSNQPTVLILDDLHWADTPTLLLLRHLIRAAHSAELLIVVAYRSIEAETSDALANLLAAIRRDDIDVQRITLTGVSEADSGVLVASVAGREVAPALARQLHHETDGNPFFLAELVRHLVETDRLAELEDHPPDRIDFGALGVPIGVREVVSRRVRQLPALVQDLLSRAALLGREFDASVLAAASDESLASVLEGLDQAYGAGLVAADPRRPGRYSFVHALVRQTLDSSLSAARRTRAHAAIAVALESMGESRHPAAVLSRHFTAAIALTGEDKVIEYASRAGRESLADYAFEDAASFFADALRIHEEFRPWEHARHIDLLIDLAGALIHVDERAGVETARRAIDIAERHGSAEQFGQAVAIFVEPMYGVHTSPAMVADLFDRALDVVTDRHPALRARLLAFQAFKYAASQLRGRDGREIADAAVTTARAAGDPTTLSDALFALAVGLEGTDAVAQRGSIGEELITIGDQAGPRATAFGLRVLAGLQLEAGDADALDTTITTLARVGIDERWLPASVYATQWATTQALIEGRFDDARHRGTELRRYIRAYRGAAGMHLMQSFFVSRDLGLLAPIGEPGSDTLDSLITQAMLAIAALESGGEEQALERLDLVAGAGFESTEHETRSGAALGMLVEVAAFRGTARHARELRALLEPFSGRLLSLVLGLACVGAADRYLGMLSTMLQEWDAASAAFDRALQLETNARGRALVPRTKYWLAWSLRRRDRAGDATEARALLDDVADTAGALGMSHLRVQAEMLRAL